MSCFFKILMLGLISIPLYWKGVMCRTDEYTLNVPHTVSVKKGQSVTIPCNFTYPALADNKMAKLYGYWYNVAHDPPVASNDDRKPKAQYARNRFHLLGELNQGICSFIIRDALEVDQGMYLFRMEKGGQKFNYCNFSTTVTVTEAPKDILCEVFGSLSTKVSFLIGLILIKVFLCSLLFFVAFWCSIWRKTQLTLSEYEQITSTKLTASTAALLPSLYTAPGSSWTVK